MKEKVLKVLDCQLDGFICPNQSDFLSDDIHELFGAIYSLIEDGVLRRRDCDGLAYEYNDVPVTVYKDTLGLYEDDNLAEILVPRKWLKDLLRAEGVEDFEHWLSEYTADDTEAVAVRALEENVIQGCTSIALLMDGAKVELHNDLFEVVNIKDGLVYLQHVNNDAHAEIAVKRFVKDADLVSEADISRSALDLQIAAAAAKGDAMPFSAAERSLEKDLSRD